MTSKVSRSVPYTINAGAIPAELKALSQWLCWRLEQRDGKLAKVPYNFKTGKLAESNDASTWSGFETVLAAYQLGNYSGIGFAFHVGDGLTGLDLDNVINPATSEIDPRALEVLDHFKATYCEVSPSGTGLRIFCYGRPRRTGKNEGKSKWLEVYDHTSPLYLTVTGHHWHGTAAAVIEQQSALDWLHAQYFTKPITSKTNSQQRTTGALHKYDPIKPLEITDFVVSGVHYGNRRDIIAKHVKVGSPIYFRSHKKAQQMNEVLVLAPNGEIIGLVPHWKLYYELGRILYDDVRYTATVIDILPPTEDYPNLYPKIQVKLYEPDVPIDGARFLSAAPIPLMPYARFTVAGIQYENRGKNIKRYVTEGMRIKLEREPQNLHDKNAIKVLTPNGAMLGYVPQETADYLAPALDKGSQYEAKVELILAATKQYPVRCPIVEVQFYGVPSFRSFLKMSFKISQLTVSRVVKKLGL